MLKKTILTTTALMTFATPLAAGELEDLKAQMKVMMERIEQLEASQKETPKVVNEGPALRIGSQNGEFDVQVTGRLLVDQTFVSDDEDNQDTNKAEIRSAQIGVSGTAHKNIKYHAVVEFSDNDARLDDTFIRYQGKNWNVSVGNIKDTIVQESYGEPVNSSFMEMSTILQLTGLGHQVGAVVGVNGERWGWNTGIYRGSINDNLDPAVDTGSLTIASRATFGGSMSNGSWGVGGSLRYRDAKDQANFSYGVKAPSNKSLKYVAVSELSDEDLFYGIDVAFQKGPVHFAGEFGQLSAKDGVAVGDDYKASAGYAEVGYFFTGEQRVYDYVAGKWNTPVVNDPVFKGGIGAIQAVVRFDYADLTDGTVWGGEQTTFIGGINWWLNNSTRMLLNYSHSDIDGALTSGLNDVNGDNSVDTFGIRAMTNW